MHKYDALVRTLDSLRAEAPPEWASYHPQEDDPDGLDRARSKAFIHLFLKARFGLADFNDRESCITDGPQDAGIDAYYLDRTLRKIYFIQSKFRTNAGSFMSREIALEDLLKMDVDRVTKGLKNDERGQTYNAKISALIDEIAALTDIGRYQFVVVVLANIRAVSAEKLARIVGNFDVDVFNHNRCYDELLFPVLAGTYYRADELAIDIDLSEKQSMQSRITYPVRTPHGDCEITLLFVPTLEIAKILHQYKKRILRLQQRHHHAVGRDDVQRADRPSSPRPAPPAESTDHQWRADRVYALPHL